MNFDLQWFAKNICKILIGNPNPIKMREEDPDSFEKGRKQAYYEVLNTIYNRLYICEQDPKDFGYSEDWEQKFLSNEEL